MSTTKIFMEKDGVRKELDMKTLPADVVSELEAAYERAPVLGISPRTFRKLAFHWQDKWAEFVAHQATISYRVSEDNMVKSKELARMFGIDPRSNLFSALCWVEVKSQEDEGFSPRNINERELTSFIEQYDPMYAFARGTFSVYRPPSAYKILKREYSNTYAGKFGLKSVGPIKFLKFVWVLFNYEESLNYAKIAR